ncbi:transglycosylase domain-containing protein [Microbacterium thalli]|uniref:Transglycosylase domain-containing protein n=1 Tax=Microbacterium thalli TaxID=3027921 RepID=A0ABT5SIB9_9MICO|nr:transglycosylase domain-containing protein [Microbacterium thalli]MDD7929218.1 transglycosylase domain-containing protein [Microbacterium thalli]MDD7961802.1 transglycosylase domain-containing protein [Microbacterium thalli]MDN8549204.1 transglycosylase domain-containing protein [Microbacterium thalli]
MPHKKRTATGVLGGLAGLVGLSAVAGVLVTATVTPAIAVSGYAASSAIDVFDNMPSYLEVDELMLPTEFYRKDSDGNDVLMTQFYDQNRIPVAWEEVAPVMYDAIISSEDKNYYTHGGVDLVGTASAVFGNLRGGDTRGGSSITQQYVKNVLQQACEKEAKSQEEVDACFRSTTVASGTDGIERKLQEMRYAIQLEKRYPKNEILLGYLNIAHFGGTVYGIGAAAQYYFSTSAANLTIGQAAAIAGMVQEPNSYRLDRPESETNGAANGYALTKDRQTYVLNRMFSDGKITAEERDAAIAEPITPAIQQRPQGCQLAAGAEFFCEYVRNIVLSDPAFGETLEDRQQNLRRGGMKVYTTLDPDLQNAALDAMSVVPANHSGMNLGSSAVQVEVGTGRVLSMVQNRPFAPTGDDSGNVTPVNYNVRNNDGGGGHSAGSTYKVFSLINWLEQGHSVNEVLNGRVGTKRVLTTCEGGTQNVRADNSRDGIGNFQNSNGYSGTVRKFTEDSLNSGFFAMAERISVCSTNQVAMKMGVMRSDGSPLDNGNQPYNVLGDAAVAPIDMAQAYASIAGGGTLCPSKVIDRAITSDGTDITPQLQCSQAISANVAATAAYTLQGVMNATGQGSRTNDGTPIFGKTGIHEYEHTWMDGASSKVATVVWVGNVMGHGKLNEYRANGWRLDQIRNAVWPVMQRAANAKFGGDPFPAPDSNLTKNILTDLPNVVGQSVEEAERALQAAGFSVNVASPTDSTEPAGRIVSQDPGPGRAPGGTTVTITPSNGEGATVPPVTGNPQEAERQLRAAGFTSVTTACTQQEDAAQPTVTGTDPAAGTGVGRSTQITIQYAAKDC